MSKSRYAVAVTFESETQAPATHRVQMPGPTTLQKALSVSLKAAKRAHPKKQWSSMVILLQKES